VRSLVGQFSVALEKGERGKSQLQKEADDRAQGFSATEGKRAGVDLM